MDNFYVLPEGCILQILSLTSPRDACRSSAISSLFKATADSDGVWEKFLPSDHRQIISRSASPVVLPIKKQLYLSLCDSPLLLDGDKLSFALDRESRKKCYTLPAWELEIAWKDDSRYWKWISLADPRFSEVAQLLYVWWLDIWGRINTAMLSANTTYAAYLIFKVADHYDFESLPVKSSVRFVKELEDGYQDDMSGTSFLTLETLRSLPRKQNGRLPQMRRDGWMEIELETFTTTMEMRVKWR